MISPLKLKLIFADGSGYPKRIFVFFLWGCFCLDASAMTAKQCFAQAQGDMEKLYCQILEKDSSIALPSFNDFRRNPPATQKLLLSRPAKKVGLALPDIELTKDKSKKVKKIKKEKDSQPSLDKKTLSAGKDTNYRSNAEHRKKQPQNLSEHCELESEKIICPGDSYYLVVNIPFKRLNKRVLAPDNSLMFRDQLMSETVMQYLSALYPQYIEKMLLIGLGDSTMSFTKFAAIYENAKSEGGDFSKRFAEMYQLLKNERRSMAVKTRYSNSLPKDLKHCMHLNGRLIVCDNIVKNWVYQKLR